MIPTMIRRLLAPGRPAPVALALLALAALCVFVAGLQHARLFHRGYAEVEIVGWLFFMNGFGSAAVVLTLIFDRAWLFVLGTLSICVPSLVSIALSHASAGFLGFREGSYDADALVIVVAEIAAVDARVARGGCDAGQGAERAMRLVLAALTLIVMGCAIAGLGMGQAPAEGQPAPGPAEIAAAGQRIAAAGATAARGRALFEQEGCDACHSLAAAGAEGALGPRLDRLDDDADDIVESITQPREDTVDGFPEKLMPTDYAQRMGDADVEALAAFIAAASGTGDGGDADSGRGRGRGRGESSGRGGRGD